MTPLQENVTGQVVRTHNFEHHIRWDYVLIVLTVLVVTYSLRRSVFTREGENESSRQDGSVPIEIGSGGGMDAYLTASTE